MIETPETLCEAALAVLGAGPAPLKKASAERAAQALKYGRPLGLEGAEGPPDRPARPLRPLLVPPGDVPKRRLGSPEGRAALLHAVAHIEFNAIDLAFDMAVRFAGDACRLGLDEAAFMADWFAVGADEARHFGLIETRLAALGAVYGDFPAHDGLWEAAENTAGSLLARLAIAPLILEARGLDVTPGMIEKLRGAGDEESAEALEIIYRDEIGHVACGKKWFNAVCAVEALDPVSAFRDLKNRYFSGPLKPPFNHDARSRAGLPRAFYEPI